MLRVSCEFELSQYNTRAKELKSHRRKIQNLPNTMNQKSAWRLLIATPIKHMLLISAGAAAEFSSRAPR